MSPRLTVSDALKYASGRRIAGLAALGVSAAFLWLIRLITRPIALPFLYAADTLYMIKHRIRDSLAEIRLKRDLDNDPVETPYDDNSDDNGDEEDFFV